MSEDESDAGQYDATDDNSSPFVVRRSTRNKRLNNQDCRLTFTDKDCRLTFTSSSELEPDSGSKFNLDNYNNNNNQENPELNTKNSPQKEQ